MAAIVPPFTSLHRRAAAWLLMASVALATACTSPDKSSYDDAFWLNINKTSQVGDTFSPREQWPGTLRRLNALGFAREDGRRFVRKVRMDALDTLRPIGHELLDGVDTVAMLSIDRNNGTRPYLYDSLQSTLTELPPGSTINVMVGDDNLGYVSIDKLTSEIGPTFAAQVNIVPIRADIMQFIRDQQFTLFARSNYNFARTLRSYDGRKGLLFLEDDIGWALGSSRLFGRLLEETDAEAISLFNPFCQPKNDGKHPDLATLRSQRMPRGRGHGTQAMLFRPSFLWHHGNYLLLRLGLNHFDLTLFGHMEDLGIPIDVIRPSMVQHMGLQSSGLSNIDWRGVSQCFFPIYPRQADASNAPTP